MHVCGVCQSVPVRVFNALVLLCLVCSPMITDKQSQRIITLCLALSLTLPLCLSLCDDSAVCWSVLLLVSRHIVYPLTRPCVQPSTPPPSPQPSSHPLSDDTSRVKLSALLQHVFMREWQPSSAQLGNG